MKEPPPMERLRGPLEEARKRRARSRAKVEELGEAPPSTGDLFALAETAEIGILWAIVEQDRSRGLLWVPLDCHLLAGTADVSLPLSSSFGAGILRCAFGEWLAQGSVSGARRCGVLEWEILERARKRRRWLAKGQRPSSLLLRETDGLLEYSERMAEVQAACAVLRSMAAAEIEPAPMFAKRVPVEPMLGVGSGLSSVSSEQKIEQLLVDWSAGEPEALRHLVDLLYDDLRILARRHMRRESPAHTLQPTALVNELFLRLQARRTVQWENRDHFFRTAGNMMRRYLVEYARKRKAVKRGREFGMIPLEVLEEEPKSLLDSSPENILAIGQALERLQAHFPRTCRVVELKYFLGLTNRETKEVLGISVRTVDREWVLAQAWLRRALDS